MPEVLRFGISSLDELFGDPTEKSGGAVIPGIYLPEPTDSKIGPDAETAEDPAEGFFTTSVCIMGPTGTGKSIFALHMASTYLSDCKIEQAKKPTIQLPTVLYISTDLTYKMANRAWSNFALNYPLSRRDPFLARTTPEEKAGKEILLKKCHPTGLAEHFEAINNEKENVVFLDMAGYTAGDDWGFLHKLLSLLPTPEDGDHASSPRHLVVIDAIEGFEALGGELNAFGEKSTRRSRIAQMMRLVAGKCHTLLVVEQAKGTPTYETLGEEFVADTVIKLDSTSARNYERRVLKVEKCRGQSHIRGQHHYSIRSGKGSTTGGQVNPDDPKIAAPKIAAPSVKPATDSTTEQSDSETPRDHGGSQSYVQVFHSVHRISRKIMEAESEQRPKLPAEYHTAFGIKYLDNMLGGKTESTEREESKGEEKFEYDTRGLPCRSTTALIGDSLTQKSTLGKAFLSRCFSTFDKRLLRNVDLLNAARKDDEAVSELWKLITWKATLLLDTTPTIEPKIEELCKYSLRLGRVAEVISEIEKVVGKGSILSQLDKENPEIKEPHLITRLAAWLLDYQGGTAVMLVTHNTDYEKLASEFVSWLHSDEELKHLRRHAGYERALKDYIKNGTICRRLEIHSLSSEVLVHIVKQAIHAAQRKIIPAREMLITHLRYRRSWPVRVVIDDFSSLRNIFPELREDPLLFPSILFHLEREGVTTLIIDTQGGKPETTIAERFETELRQMVHHRLYTWRVPFYGESRVAISAIPPLSHEYAGIVRELRWEAERVDPNQREPATVDPHFELYTGLEEGNPEPVPLHGRFYSDTPAMEQYIAIENKFLSEMFTPFAHPDHKDQPRIILGVTAPNYGDLRALAYLQRDTRLDYSYVFEVDEFWSMRAPGRHKRAGAFHPQWSYLNAITATSSRTERITPKDYVPNPHADPYELFLLRNRDPLPRVGSKISTELRRRHFYEKYYEDFEGYENFEKVQEKDTEKPNEKGSEKRSEKITKDSFHIDRVPFAWDFGFLLCQEKAWNSIRSFTVQVSEELKLEPTVQDVWRSMVKAEHDDASPSSQRDSGPRPPVEYISWRIFAEACKKAAEEQSASLSKPVAAFDFAQVSPESFSCLILEMWFSEIYDCLNRNLLTADAEGQKSLTAELDKLLETVTKRQLFLPRGEKKETPPRQTLSSLLENHWLELYKSWLLLIEVLDLSKIIEDETVSTFDLKSRNTDFCAVASRHWYKTASQCPDEIARKEPLIPVRLPGRFSVRGDWFLAISGGSRSIRQAERALDLLNSRRANVTRLQMGVGLPTRAPKSNGPDNVGLGPLYTKLISHKRGQDNVDYGTFLKVAADREKKFYWLWRSSLEDYAPYNRIWHRWLNRMLLWWHRKLLRYRSGWQNSFEVHDALTREPTKFAPDRKTLRAAQDQAKLIELPEERAGFVGNFLEPYPRVESFAQLTIRVEFLELLEGLKAELRQVCDEEP